MKRLLSILRRQEGVALPIVTGALTVTALLGTAMFQVAMEGNRQAIADRDAKRALAAASSGLEMAFLKVTQLRPAANHCVTDSAFARTADNCPWTGEQQLGNGTSYRYAVGTTDQRNECPRIPDIPETLEDRCITAIGKAGSVTRRVQSRIVYVPPFKPWGDAGIVGKDRVALDNNTEVHTHVGTNGQVSLSNNSKVWGALLLPTFAPAPTFAPNAAASEGRIDHPEWTFPNVDSLYQSAYENRAASDTVLAAAAGSAWDPSARTITPENQQAVNLTGGTYHLCGADFTAQKIKLRVAAGNVARIFVDSPRRPGSPCTAGGRFDATGNNTEINVEYGNRNAAMLEFFVYGTGTETDETPDFDVKNNAQFYGTVYAPDSTIAFKNNMGIAGGFTGRNVEVKNNGLFQWPTGVQDKSLPNTGQADRRGFFQCPSNPTVAGDPESGCLS